jgi:hypothetical protein
MAHTQHYVQRYVRNGNKLVGLPPERFKTAEEAIERGKRAAERVAGVSVWSVSGDLDVGMDITGLAEHGEVPPKIYF